jgi:hypothetical protein
MIAFNQDAVVTAQMAALYDEVRPLDFVDVHLVLRDGGYTRERLLELLWERDPAGYDPVVLAGALAELPHVPDDEFAPYGLDEIEIAIMRAGFADWYRALMDRGLRS